ncbi:MAG: hypothetical protein GJV46_09300 [Geobacter sp.]|nr:hypothetical protein [Geobacter sp.]
MKIKFGNTVFCRLCLEDSLGAVSCMSHKVAEWMGQGVMVRVQSQSMAVLGF